VPHPDDVARDVTRDEDDERRGRTHREQALRDHERFGRERRGPADGEEADGPKGPGRGTADHHGPRHLRHTPGHAGRRGAHGRGPGDGSKCRTVVHRFAPGRALLGLAALTATVLYAGDAAGSWHTPWFVVFPVVFGGLLLAGLAGTTDYVFRRRRSAMRASSESTGAPASTSGTQAIR
jgi:hypothetical protein